MGLPVMTPLKLHPARRLPVECALLPGARNLAVLRADLLLAGHHEPDARGGEEVHHGGQELEGHHEGGHLTFDT